MIRAGLTDSHALISMGATADNLAKRFAALCFYSSHYSMHDMNLIHRCAALY